MQSVTTAGVATAPYREELAGRFGFPFSDAGFEHVSGWGGGSSFKGSTNGTDLATRWEIFKDDARFREIFEDAELRELAARIFPETESIDLA